MKEMREGLGPPYARPIGIFRYCDDLLDVVRIYAFTKIRQNLSKLSNSVIRLFE